MAKGRKKKELKQGYKITSNTLSKCPMLITLINKKGHKENDILSKEQINDLHPIKKDMFGFFKQFFVCQ